MGNPFSVATGGGFNEGFNSVVGESFQTGVTDTISGFDGFDFDFDSIGDGVTSALGGVGKMLGGIPGFSDSSTNASGGTIGNGNNIDFTGGSVNFAKSPIPIWLMVAGCVAAYLMLRDK